MFQAEHDPNLKRVLEVNTGCSFQQINSQGVIGAAAPDATLLAVIGPFLEKTSNCDYSCCKIQNVSSMLKTKTLFVSNVLSCSICSVLKSGIWQNRSLAYLKKKKNSSDNNRVLGCLNTITSKTPYMWKDFLKQILYGASNHTTQVSRLY